MSDLKTQSQTIANKTDDQLRIAIAEQHERVVAGKGGSEARIKRAWLLKEYAARHGEEACDVLMDRMGL